MKTCGEQGGKHISHSSFKAVSLSGNNYEHVMSLFYSAIIYVVYYCSLLLYSILCVRIDTRWYLLFVYVYNAHMFFIIIFS